MKLKTKAEIEKMRKAGQVLALILRDLVAKVEVGMKTSDLDAIASKLMHSHGVKSAFLGYRPYGAPSAYPASICVSLNETVVHGIPGEVKIKNGDVVSIDAGIILDGWYADMAKTVIAGTAKNDAERLIAVTEESLRLAILSAEPGNTLGDIGEAVEAYARSEKVGIVRGLTGHGIGRALHEEPSVFNFGKSGEGDELVPGLVLAIEPMLTLGSGKIKEVEDGSYITSDHALAAHAEHTVAITEDGPQILTQVES